MCNTYKMVLLFALIITFHNTCITFSDLHSFITTSTGQVQLLNQFQVIQQWYKSSEVSIADLSMTSTHCNLNKINNPLKCYWLKLNSIKILYKTLACINWHTENDFTYFYPMGYYSTYCHQIFFHKGCEKITF